MVMEEILVDILKRLPVKSLIRFNCVSKFWNTLISQPYFKKTHLNHSNSRLSSQKLLFVRWDPNCQFWSGSFTLTEEDIPIFDCTSDSNIKDGIKMYSSCDGLFLIGIWTDSYDEQPSILVLWNPSTRQSIRLPHSKFSFQMGDQYENADENMGNYSNSISDHDDGLANYDSKNHEQIEDYSSSSISDYGDGDKGTTYGLAFDSKSEDYKVFRIDMSGNNDNEIFALKNGSWKIIDRKTSGRTDSGLLCGGELLPFVDGAFHWLGFLSEVCVVSFNISDEIYGEISLPDIVSSELTPFKFDNVEVQVDVHVGLSVLRGRI